MVFLLVYLEPALVGEAHVCTGPGYRQTTLGRRAKERQKGLIPLPHSFLFQRKQDPPTSNSPNTTKEAWKWVCMQLVHIPPHRLVQMEYKLGENCATETPGLLSHSPVPEAQPS